MEKIIIFEGETTSKLPDLNLNNHGQILSFHIFNKNGSAVDLTTATITFNAKKLNDFDEYLFTESATITNPTSGYCEVTIPDSITELGSFECSLVITDTSVTTINLGYLNIWE